MCNNQQWIFNYYQGRLGHEDLQKRAHYFFLSTKAGWTKIHLKSICLPSLPGLHHS